MLIQETAQAVKLPLKVEYACRVLVQLQSSHQSGKVRCIDDLAQAEKVSANYLVQILNELRNAGLVMSRRGKNGGYLLAKPAGEISLFDIVVAIEGPLLQVNSSGEGASGGIVTKLWEDVFAAFDKELKEQSLADIAQPDSADMWHI